MQEGAGGRGRVKMLLWESHTTLLSQLGGWGGFPPSSLLCASHGCPHLSPPAGACPSELVKCLSGSVPPRATLTCNKTGKKDSCALTCASKARFQPGMGGTGGSPSPAWPKAGAEELQCPQGAKEHGFCWGGSVQHRVTAVQCWVLHPGVSARLLRGDGVSAPGAQQHTNTCTCFQQSLTAATR